MKNKINDPLIKAFQLIYKETESKELSAELIKKLKPELKIVSTYLGVTQIQALFFSLIVVPSFTGQTTDLKDIGRHLSTNTAHLIGYIDDLSRMESIGLLESEAHRSYNTIISNKDYIVRPEVVNAILLHDPCPKIQKKKIESLLDAFGEIYELLEKLDDKDICTHEYYAKLKSSMSHHNRFAFFKQMSTIDLQKTELSILIYVVWKCLSGSTSVDIECVLKSLIERPLDRMKWLLDLKSKDKALTKHEFVEIVPGRFLNDLELKPSQKLTDILNSNGIHIEVQATKQNGIITPATIGEKTLFYNSSELSQVNSVKSMLEDENYKALMDRLKSKNLPISMNILLYGAPGTGKTESVLQLARMSGREIMKVEISQTKSMWFGESEKIIKKVFTDYATYAEKCAKTPILFFNEADAILGKRNELNGAVSQTQNTIQNILLEELENFKGIFMATTNLANNLDAAFERRFLFKVEFHKPSIESRAKIWMNKLSFLSENDALELATQFEFSGGQIENIVRKSEIDFILNGEDVALETLIRFCQEETLSSHSQRNQIGF